jgi:hypothetical protein
MDPVLAALNIGLIVCAGLLIHGLITRRCFAMGRWHEYARDKSGYIQVIIGYSLAVIVLAVGRLAVIEKLTALGKM